MRPGLLIAGRYRLEEPIGAGGMGVVWRAVDEQSGQVVALKRAAQPIGAGSDRPQRRMQREAQTAAQVSHSHVVTFIGEVVEGHERWLVMEYVPARSLAQILDHGPLLPQLVIHIGAQIASALEAVHAAGFMHRDVKPGNILVTADGTAKLADFGISRPIYGDVTVTDSGAIGGTVAFLGPEVANGQEPTPASDVFALGATLFAAVEGTPPFGAADNPWLVLRRAAAGDIRPFRLAGPLIPVLSAVLRSDPADRPDAWRVQQLLDELATTTGHPGPEQWRRRVRDAGRQPPQRRQRPRRRRAMAVAGASVAALATVAGLLVFRPATATIANPLPVLGDPRTADPCALTDARSLSQFSNGTTSYESAYGNFNRCDVIVTLSGGTRVQIKVELDKPAPPEGTMDTVGAFRVFREPENDGYCDRTVPLADQNRVTIMAKLLRSRGTADLCALADAATNHALAVLSKGPIPRRAEPFDAASLARMEACPLLDSSTVTRILGAGASNPEPGFGNWDCRWNSTSGQSVLLAFDRNIPLNEADDGRRITLSGRDVYLKPEADTSGCRALVVYRSDVDENGEQADELLKIHVEGPQTPDQLCGPATEIAQAAAAKLPQPA